jgi:PAS domain S-box-containing protein
MSQVLRVLIVEDSEDDALLIIRNLTEGGFEPRFERVETEAGMRKALQHGIWDLILADYALPHLRGPAALKLFKEMGLDVPFIIVSGTIGEDIAIEAMKLGAQDYIMKDKLGRLVPSVRRELDDARIRGEKREAEEALRESAAKWVTTFNAITDGICLLDPEARILQCNEAIASLLARPVKDIIGRKCYEVVHGGTDFFMDCPFPKMLVSKAHEEAEFLIGDRWFLAGVDPILDADGGISGAVHILSDITKRKAAEEQLRESLREKEVLLREVYHRVKNNMQVMASLLSLQARAVADPAVAEALKESQNRIRSMAIVHEKLYRSPDLNRIDFGDYIRQMVVHLIQSLGIDPDLVGISLDLDEAFLDVNTAVPCGLILNELVSNSVKHGFPKGRKGELAVEFRDLKEGRYRLTVRDDGVGLPDGLDIKSTESLGMQIIQLLVEQLGGTIELRRKGGTEFRITFQELKYQSRI